MLILPSVRPLGERSFKNRGAESEEAAEKKKSFTKFKVSGERETRRPIKDMEGVVMDPSHPVGTLIADMPEPVMTMAGAADGGSSLALCGGLPAAGTNDKLGAR